MACFSLTFILTSDCRRQQGERTFSTIMHT
jgi:hypothetical protein